MFREKHYIVTFFAWAQNPETSSSGEIKFSVVSVSSMEECDALCTKIAIMVNGQFKCLGSPQHLKSKFGEGYTVIIKIAAASPGVPPDNEPMKEFITATFPGSVLKDQHEGLVHYQIVDLSVTLGGLFGVMESVRERFNVDDYSVNQTTLEQVFINFARTQNFETSLSGEIRKSWRCSGCCRKIIS